jgi:CelD/BcsL family acetyltransferase involved in cellulose biosynthesis
LTITGTLEVLAVDPAVDPRWERLATGGAASLFTSPPWIAAVCGTYGFTPEARVAVDPSGTPVGGLAWVRVEDPRGPRLLSLPFCDRADPLVSDRTVWDAVSTAVTSGETPFTVRCLDGCPAVGDPRLRVVGESAWHETPLDTDLDELRGRLSGTSRRNIATAERTGVSVEVRSDLEAVHTMHTLHVRLRKHKYRLLAQPVALFERIWQEFTVDGGATTLLARAGAEVVAAALFLEWDGVLYYKFGASDPDHLRLRPNDALYWAAIRLAAQRGLRSVDWGLSDLDQPGLVAFKRKWASVERSVLTLRAGEPASGPSEREFARTMGELTTVLTDPGVPDDITGRAGALLYRYFC